MHKVKGVGEAIRSVGAAPPYAPSVNPIEIAWSKKKTRICSDSP